MSRWISTDPALAEGKYFPKSNDYDTEHDFYWYLQQDGSKKLPGIGGVFNAVNMDVYHYAGQNPVRFIDQKGEDVFGTLFEVSLTGALGFRYQVGYAIDSELNVYSFSGFNLTNGSMISIGVNTFYSNAKTADEYFKTNFITLEGGIYFAGIEIGVGNNKNNEINFTGSKGLSVSPQKMNIGLAFNFCSKETSNIKPKLLTNKREVMEALKTLKKAAMIEMNSDTLKLIKQAIDKYSK
jgi:hypothetical protein